MKRKSYRTKSNKKSESNQEDYLCELYGLDMIIGYTSGGVPYGPTNDNSDVDEINDEEDDDLPF